MENFEDIIKLQQQYEFLKKHPETKVYPFQDSDTDRIDSKFFFYKAKKKWQRIKRVTCIIIAVLLFAFLMLLDIGTVGALLE